MPAIVEVPQVVREALPVFADLFAGEPQRRHFAEYLTGLIVASRKTVTGIHDEWAETTDQSCLNRFLTEAEWSEQDLNERRLEWLQQEPETRYCAHGVIAIDNVLIDHDGKFIEDVGWFWDHAEQRNKIAHDCLISNYVCPSGRHYAIDFRRFQKRDQCAALGAPFQDHTTLCCQLIDHVCDRDIPGDFAFDSYFTNAPIQNHIQGKIGPDGRPRGYVGDLKTNRKVEWRGRMWTVKELAASIASADRKEIRRGDQRQWYFTCTLRIPLVNHKVRILILWRRRHDQEPCKVLASNRLTWEVHRIQGVYRNRWTGTETFHRDGKQQLGMGDCQLRSGLGQTRHMYLVMLAYSILMRQLRQNRAKEWALQRLTTIGQACRAIVDETLRTTLAWAIEQATHKSQKPQQIFAVLGLM